MLKRLKASHIWERDPLDYYTEPHWCSERLFAEESFQGTIVDPCCGMGRIYFSAKKAGYPAIGCDIVKRMEGTNEIDFMAAQGGRTWDNIVSNPPFTLCDRTKDRPRSLVDIALERTRQKCALLMPTLWMQADERSRWLETTPLYKVLLLTPRPSMPPGRVIEAGEKPGGGRQDFAWFVWLKGYKGPAQVGWLRRDP
jgi:hypothetical protein